MKKLNNHSSIKCLPLIQSVFFIALFSCFSFSYYAQTCDCKGAPDYEKIENSKDIKNIIQRFQKSPNKACQAKGYEYAAQYGIYNNQLDSVDYFLRKQKRLLDELACAEDKFEFHYYLCSYYYFLIDDQGKMIESCYQGLLLAESLKNEKKIVSYLYNLCLGYKNLKQPKLVKKYASRLYEIVKKIPDKKFKMEQLQLVANQYLVLYQDLNNTCFLDTMKLQVSEALDLAKQFKDTMVIIGCYRKTETYYFYKEDYSSALDFNSNSMQLANSLENPPMDISNVYADRAEIYLKMGAFVNAEKYVDSAIVLAFKRGNNNSLLNAYDIKIEVARVQKDFKTVYEYSELKNGIEDSLLSLERHETIYELEQKYQKSQDLQKISDLSKDQKISQLRLKSLVTIIVIIFLILIIIVILWRQNGIKSKYALIEKEQRLNRARMDPHFFFNALSSIQTMALNEQSPNTALVLAKFTKVMRQSLESTYLELNTIEDEFAFLRQYLELQKLRYAEKFEYEFDVSEEVEVDEIQIPSMILQPFIENSIEHGFKGMENGGLVEISVRKERNNLEICVSDNGEAFNDEKKNIAHKSRATEIIKDRLFLLKKQTGKEAFFEVISNEKQKGYQIKLTLPLIYKDI